MNKVTLKIDGMMCAMCEAHICETIRKAVPVAKKVTASKGKKEASFLTEEAVDLDALKAAVDATGYAVKGVEFSCLKVADICTYSETEADGTHKDNLDGKSVIIEKDRTKTKSSYRTLPLVKPFEDALLRKREEQEQNRKLCGRSYDKSHLDYINLN